MRLTSVFSSLRSRVILLVCLSVLPALGILYVTAVEQAEDSIREAQEEAERLARLAASHQARLVESAGQFVTLAATKLPEVRAGEPEGCNRVLAELHSTSPAFGELGVAESDGDVWCSSVPASLGANIADESFFQRVATTGAPAAGAPRRGAARQRPSITFGYPIRDGAGRVDRIVFATIDLTWLSEFADAAELREGASVTVIDEQGVILARHPDPAAWVGERFTTFVERGLLNARSGFLTATDVDGVERLLAYRALHETDLADAHVIVGIAQDVALGLARRALVRNLLAMAAVLAAALAAAWLGSDVLVRRRMAVLATAAERWSRGDLGHRASISGGDEIARIVPGLNAMAERLAALLSAEHEARAKLAREVDRLVELRTRDVTFLNQQSELLQACATTEEAHGVIARAATYLFPDAAGAVFSIDPAQDVVSVAASWGGVAPRDPTFPRESCWALRRGRPHVVHAPGDPACAHLADPLPARSLCVPMVAHGQALGVLHVSVAHTAAGEGVTALSEERQRLAATFAEQCALALANIQLRESLRSQSLRDPLTGLSNRRHAKETLDREVARAQRTGRPLSVVMIDLDHFKRVNDAFGHEAGDSVLREFAILAQSHARAADTATRYGGEEFMLILPETSREEGVAVAERLRDDMKRMLVTHRGRAMGHVTISAGVAEFPADGSTGDDVVRAADVALYRAKEQGRDRVVASDRAVGVAPALR